MGSAKVISNKKYSEIFLIMGAIVLILGVILKFVLDRAVLVDISTSKLWFFLSKNFLAPYINNAIPMHIT